MLFFKQKQKTYDILPPPPPSSDLELEQEIKEKPKFFDEIIKPKKAEALPEEEEFGELVKEVEELKPKKALRKGVKATPKKILKIKKQIMPIKVKPTQLKKISVQKLKEKVAKPKKLVQSKPIKKLKLRNIKTIKKAEQKKPQVMPEEFGLKDIDFELPKELEEPKKGIELPETLEGFDIDKLGKELEQKAKPNEILEAQEEIQSAIEKIKKWNASEPEMSERVVALRERSQSSRSSASSRMSRETRSQLTEKPSFFNRLFERKEKEKQEESYPTFSIPNGDGLSIIQSNIKKARDALMRFDLKTAKKNYIEIMRWYNNLSPQDKAKVYNDINELYSERKSAEELKV